MSDVVPYIASGLALGVAFVIARQLVKRAGESANGPIGRLIAVIGIGFAGWLTWTEWKANTPSKDWSIVRFAAEIAGFVGRVGDLIVAALDGRWDAEGGTTIVQIGLLIAGIAVVLVANGALRGSGGRR